MSEIVAAFIKMQQDLPKIGKDSEADTGKFSYKYATLPHVLETVLPVMNKHGFGLIQRPESGEIHTEIMHESGDVFVSRVAYPTEGVSPQDLGKWFTYLKRYALISMLGICPDEDDDAQGVPPADVPPPADEDQAVKYAVASVTARLLRDEKSLVKEWSPGATTVKAATEMVSALLYTHIPPGTKVLNDEQRDELYEWAKHGMSAAVDERNA